MYPGDSALIQSGLVEQAGTLDFHSLNSLGITKSNGAHTEDLSNRHMSKPPGTEEGQTLEWHEVIELQAFSERKAWIEEKIKFLERMPPVEVFTGLDAIRNSAEEVPGLPTRAELEQWVVEHDRIEKETEIFDSGELAKLKKFTKAATQRNLSPADTDLIELTLTTIYELDKLLHLLRDRSDNLELLGIRLTWEERRISAWQELRSILTDLRQFLRTRGRWSPLVYDNSLSEDEESAPPPVPEHSPPFLPTRTIKRKGSVVSLASSTSDSILPSLVMSRSERFKLAERLSRAAAQFSSRVSSLKHNKIHAAGKALDQLIDTSRKPVPEELLDEQDKLEDRGLNAMEDVGKFVMSVVIQWKKADEIYVETMKDKNTAQTLLEEIETAKLFHPTSRQDTAFLARTTTLLKRLEMRGDPSASKSSFPQPYHPLFEDQIDSNATIVDILTSELASAVDHARKAEIAAKEYHAVYEAVRKAEMVCKAATELSEKFGSILERLEKGTKSTAGDGSPPDLTTEECLQPTSHSVFLSLFPTLLEELSRTDEDAGTLLQKSRLASLAVGRPGIDLKFVSDFVGVVDHLDAQRTACFCARDLAEARVSTLQQVRLIWSSMARILEQLDDVRAEITEAIKRDMWKPQVQHNAAILTPESPASVLPPGDVMPSDCSEQLANIQLQLHQDVSSRLEAVSTSLGPGLRTYLSSCSSGLVAALEDARRSAIFSVSVKTQAQEMTKIREDAHALQIRLEELKLRFDGVIQQTLSGVDEGRLATLQEDVCNELKELKESAHTFVNEVPRRLPFVSRAEPNRTAPHTSLGVRRRFSASGCSLDIIQQARSTPYPVSPTELDSAVRIDVNSYSMLMAGTIETLTQKDDLLQLAFIARDVDRTLPSPSEALQRIGETVSSIQRSLDEQREASISLERLSDLSELVDRLYPEHGPAIASSLSKLRRLLDQLHDRLNKHDPITATKLLSPRRSQVENLEQQFDAWKENVEVLSECIADMRHLEQVRIAEEAHERRRLEEARAKEEQEHLERKARKKTEEAQMKEERAMAEQERLEARSRAECSEQLLFPMEEDVFAQGASSGAEPPLPQELSELQAHIRSLRKRLHHLGIDEIARVDKRGATPLPSHQQSAKLEKQLSSLVQDLENLSLSAAENPTIDSELHSLRADIASALEAMAKIKRLACLANDIQNCDHALSDLLEHIDSFPAPPAGPLASSYAPDTYTPPEEQLSARLSFTRGLIDEIVSQCSTLADDSRAVPERERILQTWEELQAMALDRLSGQKSRPASVISSGRSSRASVISTPASSTGVSASAPVFPKREDGRPEGRFLAPPLPHSRRIASTGTVNAHSRSSSRASISTKRSVSGPIDTTPTISRLQATTFASRQRSASVTTTSSPAATPTVKKHNSRPSLAAAAPIVSRPRAQTAHSHRAVSPALSEASTSRSRSSLNASQSSVSRSSWARAPRPAFPVLPKASPPRRRQTVSANRPYIPNPKNKLDVALGDVVNSLPVDINIEVVEDTWRDQSGKYWIGDEDPKLCFCRILRSQTVMVRVGGGWAELSKFIKEHFADAFRLLPDSPSRVRVPEERWISSMTLTQAIQIRDAHTPLSPPRTPEPRSPIPSFAISTASPRSGESPGSPLRAIQFIRRADRDSPVLRPDTPTKMSRPLGASMNTPRHPVWRP